MKSSTFSTLDPKLWRACAGKMVGVPTANTTVFYFPQGHAENANCSADYAASLGLPPLLLCRVQAVRLMANSKSDEVFAAITLLPLPAASSVGIVSDEEYEGSDASEPGDGISFAKILTQSDANNGGGFSVPRNCADSVFPQLNFDADPPVQDLYARDVHGEIWKFRHIYRGTPRRHLLTSGWSVFVNKKSLVSKDSIVFLRAESGEIRVGIRRARSSLASAGQGSSRQEEFEAAVSAAARGEAFDVVYYPRDGAAEFCVRASAVRAALAEQWCSGLRMKMEVEDEATSRIRACNGSVSAVKAVDPIRWSNSPWRILQVSWDDEPDRQQNPPRVSPWTVQAVSSMPIYSSFPPYPQPNKKLYFNHRHPDFTLENQFDADPLGYLRNTTTTTPSPAGIQGARHFVFKLPLPELQLPPQELSPEIFPNQNSGSGSEPEIFPNQNSGGGGGDLSGLSGVEQASPNSEERYGGAPPKKLRFSLFGTVIEGKEVRAKHEYQLNGKSPLEDCASDSEGSEAEFGVDGAGQCKIFKDFLDIGWTIDLSVVGSFEELYERLAKVFKIERSAMTSRVLYHDSSGAPKKIEDQPFGNFRKKAKRLTILSDPDLGNDIRRRVSPEM